MSNCVAATQGLSIKFLGSIHLLSKNAAGENMQKAKNIQDQFVSILDVMAKLAERIKQYDMLLPLQVPKDYYDVVNVEDRWDMTNPQRKIVYLSKHWGKLSSEHCNKWQCDFNGYCSDIDHVSNVWLKDLISNSLDPELKKQVDEKYWLLDDYQKSDISYFKIAVDTIFKMSSMAKDSLKSFMKEFGKQGLAKISHENVLTIATQMDGVAKRLPDADKLRTEALIQYMTGLMICSVPSFKSVFMNRLTELTYLDATGDVAQKFLQRSRKYLPLPSQSTTTCMWATSGTFLVSLAFMLMLSASVTIVVLSTTSPPSVLSLVMRKSARRLVMHVLKPRKTPRQKVLVVEAVEGVVDVEVELVTEENVLLGMIANSGVMNIEVT